MNEYEMLTVLAALVSGVGLTGFVIHRITALIRIRMERKYNLLTPDQIKELQNLKDLQAWRIRAEKRLQHLEEIVADEQEPSTRHQNLLDAKQGDDLADVSRPVPNQLRNRS